MPSSAISYLGHKPNIQKRQEIPGVFIWDNPGNGTRVVETFYHADPGKNPGTEAGQKFLSMALMGYKGGVTDRKWQAEMEINDDVPQGRAAHESFSTANIREFRYDPNYIVNEGWDFGRFPAVAWMQVQREKGKAICRLHDMQIGLDVDFDDFAEEMFKHRLGLFGRDAIYNTFPDPAGMARRTIKDKYGYKSDMEFLRNAHKIFPKLVYHPLVIFYKKGLTPRLRIEILNKLIRRDPLTNQTGFEVHHRATVAQEGFQGGFCYPELKDNRVVDVELMNNFYKHGHDAIGYPLVFLYEQNTGDYPAGRAEELYQKQGILLDGTNRTRRSGMIGSHRSTRHESAKYRGEVI